jgi:Ca-activated chloride channel family protein
MGDYYELLGLDRTATAEDIRDAYFELARATHPDTNPVPSAMETFLEIQEAYEVLRDPHKRRKYDSYLPGDAAGEPKIKITAKLSKSAIASMDEPQLLYALVDMECIASEEDHLLPQAHYCFVIDRSTSMSGERIEMVKANFKRILPKLHANDLVSIVTFSDWPEILCASSPVIQIDAIDEKIQGISCSGSTEIYKGLKAGVDLLRLGGIHNPALHLILLTDGRTYGDEEACLELARQAFTQGITISAMGLGHEWDDVFLDKLASCTGGSTVFVKSEEDLYNYLNHKIFLGNTIYAGNLRYEFKSDPDVNLKNVFRLQPELMPLDIKGDIPLGDLAFGSKSQFLFEFVIGAIKSRKESIHLSRGRVKMDVYSAHTSTAKIRLNLSARLQDRVEKENPPVEIVKALSKLTLYQMQERNSRDVGNGEYHSAVKRMHYLASKLLSSGDRALARQILMEAENVNNQHSFSAEGEKRIKYGTRGLFLLPEPKPRIS